ncbi:hypothetical protein BGW80DRAFT_1311300 [Lactifluus volemus]|nr:hypothetical protein BGW80DRAFT_1311300 [Lactifluus volemus]
MAVTASNVIELISSRSITTSLLFIYDIAEQAGFGLLAKTWSKSDQDVTSLVSLQTRPGAGLSLVGRLSQGTSRDALTGSILTAYTTPTGLVEMIPSLAHSPTPVPNSRLVLQVPTVSTIGDQLTLSPTLASLNPESVDFAALAYNSSREMGPLLGSYHNFDYSGDKTAQIVLVVLNGPLALALKAILVNTPNIGVLTQMLPSTASHIHVIEDVSVQASRGILHADVQGSMMDLPSPIPDIHHQALLNKPSSLVQFLTNLPLFPSDIKTRDVSTAAKLLFFSTPSTSLSSTFAQSASVSARLLTEHDVLSRQEGITADRIWLEPRKDLSLLTPLSITVPISGDGGGGLLKSHSLLKHAKRGASILIATSWLVPELVSNLSTEDLHLYTIDAKSMASDLGLHGDDQNSLESVIVHLAFLRLYLGSRASETAILKLTENLYGTAVSGVQMTTLITRVWQGLIRVDMSTVTAEPNDGQEARKDFGFNAIAVIMGDGETVVNARHLLFPRAFVEEDTDSTSTEQYPQIPTLHPEVPDRTYLVTCTYDRTGLKYSIAEVLDFCNWYGIDPARLVTIPVPGNDTKVHTRTVFQALQQQIDLFGKPPKSFFSDLAEFAKGSADRHALLFIGSLRLSDKDTVTFADVLRRFPSARPGIEVLCELIGDIKPRHYSIASSQSVVGNRVDLLVVTVEWDSPNGTKRYGQCTRYLAELKIGQKVTVSIKPSVMKLPEEPTQPLIMVGLGTGAAPFRAFLQHRSLLVSQGVPVGPVYYYFGWDYHQGGLAFSRDGPKKVYIQHKMVEDDKGVFYLCGPTWPVPDVYATLIKAFEKHRGMDVEAAQEERYVLEVY